MISIRSTAAIVGLTATLLSSGVVSAQTAPEASRTQSVAQNDANDPRAMRLTLDEAIRTAAERNLGVAIQSYQYREAGYDARGTYGIFDPLAFADASAASSERPLLTTIESPKTDNIFTSVGVNQTIPTGGVWSVNFNNGRNESSSSVATVGEAFSSDIGFDFTQPLMRNFGVDVTRRFINIARNNLGISREEFRNVLTQTTLAVEMAYWDLIFARQNLEVKQQSRSLAADQERITQIRIDVGASAPLDILQPRVAIATREEEVITAEARIRDAEDRLRRLMNLAPEEWDRPIIPAATIEFQPVSVDAEAAVAQAWERRPEVQQLRLGTDIRRIQHMYARNQVRPRLDFRLEYGLAGLGGDEIIRDDNGAPIGVRQGGYGDAIEQVYGFDFPSWTVGLNFGLPIRNISARSEAKRAELELERSQADEQRLRQDIALDVRQSVRDIDTLARQIAATRAARDAAERNLEAERRRYENGMTTNFNVLEVQQQLSDARSREIAALVAYNQAVADYHRAVGDLLEARNIAVSEPEAFDLPRSRYEDVKWLNYSRTSN
jgi:outer membrane protein